MVHLSLWFRVFFLDAFTFFLSNVEGLSNPQLIYPAPCPAYPLPGICGQSHLNCSLTTNISLALFFNMVSKWGSVKWCKLQAKSKFSIFQNLWIKFREAASSATAQTKTPGVQTSGSKGPELANRGKKCWVVHFGTCGREAQEYVDVSLSSVPVLSMDWLLCMVPFKMHPSHLPSQKNL